MERAGCPSFPARLGELIRGQMTGKRAVDIVSNLDVFDQNAGHHKQPISRQHPPRLFSSAAEAGMGFWDQEP